MPGLDTHRLKAFSETARLKSFTRAAKRLHVTQSALSQRIAKLEEEIGATLFMRLPSGVALTETGRRLLRYCQAKEQLDTELLRDLGNKDKSGLSGPLRVAAYSSVLRSVVVPSLAPLLRANPAVAVEFLVRQASELPGILRQAAADFVILDRRLSWRGIEAAPLGSEEYVVIEGVRRRGPADVYLDNDPEDDVTRWFFAGRPEAPDYRRCFMSNVYGILDGVAAGLGRAVVPSHLLKRGTGVRRVEEFAPRTVQTHVHYYRLPAPSLLHRRVLEALVERARRYLAGPPTISSPEKR